MEGNDKHAILEALISSNDKVWGEFKMHPLKINMHLATAAAAQAHGGLLSQEEEDQLRYADMLLDVSNNRNSPWCQVIQKEDENSSKLGFPFMQYLSATVLPPLAKRARVPSTLPYSPPMLRSG